MNTVDRVFQYALLAEGAYVRVPADSVGFPTTGQGELVASVVDQRRFPEKLGEAVFSAQLGGWTIVNHNW